MLSRLKVAITLSKSRPVAAFLALLSLSLFSSSVRGQVVTGSLLGTIKDQSGNVIPGATIAAILADRNLQRTVTANDSGEYELDFLPVGVYRITASMDGFKSQVQENVQLRIDQRLRVDFTLQVGSINQQVIVSGEVPLVNTDSPNIGEVLDQTRVTELPLKGRQFVELVILTPGATPEASGQFGGQFSLAGSSVNVNGNRSDSNNFLLDGVPINDSMWGRMAISPSVDAIGEMKVQSFLYSAEFGSAGGGQVNVTLRSGQNQFHGTGFGFFRRDEFDARNFFATAKPPLSQNDYGLSVGGPIIHSKVFFFANFERLTTLSGTPLVSTLPTEALRNGDFSGFAPIIDPTTNAPFPGNKIPADRIDPVSAAVLGLVPIPTGTSLSNNYNVVEDEQAHSTQFNLKLDYQLSERDLFSGHFSIADLFGDVPAAGSPPGFTPRVTLKTRTVGVQWTRVINPKTVNQARFGYTYSDSAELSANPDLDFASQVGILGTSHAPQVLGVPRFTATGFSTIGDLTSTLNGTANDYHFIDDFSRTIGNHSLKTGIVVSRLLPSPFFFPTPRGSYNYLGGYTGNSFADFLLGLPTTGSVGVGDPLVNGRAWRIGTYVQDDWRVTPHLTLNLGLRYELLTPPTESSNRLSNLDLTTGDIILPCNNGQPSSRADLSRFPQFTFVCNGDVGLGKGLTKSDYNDWGPRLGFAYSTLKGKWVLRGGYGIFYSYPPMAVRIGTPSFSVPFFSQTTATNSHTAPVSTANLFTVPGVNAFAGQPFSTDYLAGRTHQWTLDIQHQFGASRLLDVAYIGSHGTNLNSEILANQATPGPGPIASRTPFPLLANSLIQSGPYAMSNFDALQIRFEQRLWHGLTLVTHYTYGKSLDDASNLLSNSADGSVPQNSRNIEAEYARSNFDVRHRFVADGLYQLPFRFDRRPINTIFGGWQLGLALILQSNLPLSPVLPTDVSGTGAFMDRPNQVGDPNGGAPRTPQQWFNTSAFQKQTAGTFGNAGRNTINGPNYQDVDMSLTKRVVITERQNVELRVESFNLLNRANFNMPNRNFGTAQFGTITSAQDARVMQFGAKYYF
jgi:hypothetical protein